MAVEDEEETLTAKVATLVGSTGLPEWLCTSVLEGNGGSVENAFAVLMDDNPLESAERESMIP